MYFVRSKRNFVSGLYVCRHDGERRLLAEKLVLAPVVAVVLALFHLCSSVHSSSFHWAAFGLF